MLKKVQLRSTKNGMKSGSLKRVAQCLTDKLGYKVWRTINIRADRKQFLYGDAVNKLEQYKFYEANKIPSLPFTTKVDQVRKWLADGQVVFGRKVLNGSCGAGIVEIEPGAKEIPACPVYTVYKKKKREFRVHIFKDQVVAIVEKRKRIDWNGPNNSRIRNLAHGYVFCQDVEMTEKLRQQIIDVALAAAAVTDSDFRGVDLCYNEKNNEVFVVETNSAPGIEGANVEAYAEAIASYAV